MSGPYCINEYVKQIYQRNNVTTPVIKCVSIQLYKFNLTHTQQFSINGYLNLYKPVKQTLNHFLKARHGEDLGPNPCWLCDLLLSSLDAL